MRRKEHVFNITVEGPVAAVQMVRLVRVLTVVVVVGVGVGVAVVAVVVLLAPLLLLLVGVCRRGAVCLGICAADRVDGLFLSTERTRLHEGPSPPQMSTLLPISPKLARVLSS